MRTLGIDLSSRPANTAAAVLDDATGRIETLRKGLDDEALLALAEGVDAIGLDAPFGWPLEFARFLAGHQEGATPPLPWDDPDLRHRMRFRRTDLWLWKEEAVLRRPPLSVSTDSLALPALRCAGLLRRLGVTDRGGDGRVFETYPAAGLHVWTGRSSGYKGRGKDGARAGLRAALERRFGLDLPSDVDADDDRFDAVVAALLARAAVRGHTMGPGPDAASARVEGWIHVPGLRPDDPRLRFLEQHGADRSGHSGRALLDHLRGTWQLLSDWGEDDAVCDAGLFHSVYGTESYRHQTVPAGLRSTVRDLVGERAERLAWWFGRRSNASFAAQEGRSGEVVLDDRETGEPLPVDASDWRDLCALFLANGIEQRDAIEPERRASVEARFAWVGTVAGGQAGEAWRRV